MSDEAWYHADFCHAYAWVYEDGDRLRVKWGERNDSDLTLHRRAGCDRCTSLARGYEKARNGEFHMEKPSAEFSSVESFFAVLAEIAKWVPGLMDDEAVGGAAS